ncbi:alpha/beta-hydrolase [Amylocystis lapponica]|nr:alpha/beta-hydrolase [Amylocystis lapponica]
MPFTFRHQPYKGIVLVGSVLILLIIRLPFWTLTNIIPSWRPRRSWSLRRSLIVHGWRAFLDIVYATSLPEPPAEAVRTAPSSGFVSVDAAPDLVVGEILELAELNHVKPVKTSGYWCGPRGPSGEVGYKAVPGQKMGSGHPSGLGMKTLFGGYLEHFPNTPRVFALEYRISSAPPFASANPFPAALIDALAGYHGDSAGGHLALALSRYLALNDIPGLPTARGLLLLSPAVDWAVTHNGAASSMQRNTRSDFLGPVFSNGYSKAAFLGHLPEDAAATNAWISPASLKLETPGLFAGSRQHASIKADVGSGEVKYIEGPDAVHDFLLMDWHEPERTNALKEIAEWIGGL